MTRFYRDADGNLVKKSDGAGTVMIVNGVYEEAGGVATSYYTFGGQRVAMRVAGAVYWLHGDHLGSASLTTNVSGQKVAELRYLPFGETRWAWGTTPTDRRYTGQRELAGVGLYDYNARMYWPGLGRFISADSIVQTDSEQPAPYLPLTVSYANPKALEQWNLFQRERQEFGTRSHELAEIQEPQFLNRYAYVRGNPLRYTDPDGHIAFAALLIPGLIGAAAGGLGYIASVALTGQEFNAKSFAVAAGVGFVAGALAPVVAVNTAGAVFLGGLANTAQYALTQAVNEQPLNVRDGAVSLATGMVGGAIAGPYTANVLRSRIDLPQAKMVAPEFYKEISRQIRAEDRRLALGNLFRSTSGNLTANTLSSVELDKSAPGYAGIAKTVYGPNALALQQ